MCEFYFFFKEKEDYWNPTDKKWIVNEWNTDRGSKWEFDQSYVIAQPCMCKRDCVCVQRESVYSHAHTHTQIHIDRNYPALALHLRTMAALSNE